MTQRFERRLPNTSYGIHDAEAAAQAGSMTLEELERYFYQAIVDDYQQAWDKLRRHKRCMLWEHAVAQRGVPQYLGSPDDLKLLLIPQGTDGPGAIAVRSSTWAVSCCSSARQDHPAESETLDQPDLTWLQWSRRHPGNSGNGVSRSLAASQLTSMDRFHLRLAHAAGLRSNPLWSRDDGRPDETRHDCPGMVV